MMIISGSSMPPPIKAVLSSLLAASVVLTGVVPGLEMESLPAGRNSVTRVVATAGVPNSAAATFNTEQAAIAETWVRG